MGHAGSLRFDITTYACVCARDILAKFLPPSLPDAQLLCASTAEAARRISILNCVPLARARVLKRILRLAWLKGGAGRNAVRQSRRPREIKRPREDSFGERA